MTDYKALCAELLEHLEQNSELLWHYAANKAARRTDLAIDRARAALAEPKPTFDENWEMLKEQLWYKWKTKGYQGEEFMYDSNFDQAMDEARAALAEPVSDCPACEGSPAANNSPCAVCGALAEGDGVVVTDAASRVAHYLEQRRLIRGLDPEVIHHLHAGTDEPRQATLAVSDLGALICTHPRPIPVAERLPTETDCDAEGRCWWWYPETMHFCGYWQWEADAPERDMDNQPVAWLPAAAIPLPEMNK
jgi:hypothetical protein